MATNPALLMLKGMLSEFTDEQQKKIEECAAKLRSTIEEYGSEGLMALAMIGLEKQEEE